MLVHVSQTQNNLVDYLLDFSFWEGGRPVLHELVNVLLHEFKYEVQVVVHSDNLLELHDLRVV